LADIRVALAYLEVTVGAFGDGGGGEVGVVLSETAKPTAGLRMNNIIVVRENLPKGRMSRKQDVKTSLCQGCRVLPRKHNRRRNRSHSFRYYFR
jgi:hypothetical protein